MCRRCSTCFSARDAVYKRYQFNVFIFKINELIITNYSCLWTTICTSMISPLLLPLLWVRFEDERSGGVFFFLSNLSNLQSRKLSGQISQIFKSLKSSIPKAFGTNLSIPKAFGTNLSNHPSGYVIRINSFNSCLTPNKKATFQKKMLIFRKVALYKYKE